MPARARKWVMENVVRFVKALDALVADGSAMRDGRVRVLSVYERPCPMFQFPCFAMNVGARIECCASRGIQCQKDLAG